MPDRIDRDLHHRDAAVLVHDIAIGLEPLRQDRGTDFRQIEPRACHRDARADIGAFGDLLAEIFRDQVTPGVERDDAVGFAPLRERPDGRGGERVGEIGAADRIERAGRDRERPIDGVGAAMAADHIAVRRPRHGTDDRSARARVGSAPLDRESMLATGLGMRGEADMVGSVRAAHSLCSRMPPKTTTARRSDGPMTFGYKDGPGPPDLLSLLIAKACECCPAIFRYFGGIFQ